MHACFVLGRSILSLLNGVMQKAYKIIKGLEGLQERSIWSICRKYAGLHLMPALLD